MADEYAKGVREKLGGPACTTKLNGRCLTIAEALGAGGYETMMAGKWHVGSEREAWPDKRGFARTFCVVGGPMNYFGGDSQLTGGATMQLQLDGKPWSAPREGLIDDRFGCARPEEAIATHEIFAAALESRRAGAVVTL